MKFSVLLGIPLVLANSPYGLLTDSGDYSDYGYSKRGPFRMRKVIFFLNYHTVGVRWDIAHAGGRSLRRLFSLTRHILTFFWVIDV